MYLVDENSAMYNMDYILEMRVEDNNIAFNMNAGVCGYSEYVFPFNSEEVAKVTIKLIAQAVEEGKKIIKVYELAEKAKTIKKE